MKILSQRDPAWSSLPLGSKKLLTIGAQGCTTTALAELNNAWGAQCTPAQVASHLDWYTPEGLVMWDKINLQYALFEPMGRVYGYDAPRVADSLISPGKGVLVQVSIPCGTHWLKGEAIGYNNAVFGRDPWTGTLVDVISKYGGIIGSAHFTKRIIP